MSIRLCIDSLTDEVREKISSDLQIKIDPKFSSFGQQAKYIDVYQVEGSDVIIPFGYAIQHLGIKKPKADAYPAINTPFVLPLREYQTSIKDEAIQHLNKTGAVLISCYPGCGKTSMSIYIASKIKLKTLIILNRLLLITQWEDSIKKFCPSASVCSIKPSKKNITNDYDFVIINAINVGKYGRAFFKDFGTVIIDEAHLIMSEVLSKSLIYLFPKYVIGLSATPYRPDGLNSLLDFYFTNNKIVRKLFRKHIVYKVSTKFTPEIEYDRNGKVIWGKILELQCNNVERNNLIVDIAKKHSDRIFLILSKRVEQVLFLKEKLLELGESVTTLVGNETEFNKDARILIGTTGKVGVGFDHPKLDALIIASDLEEYFIQYLGRVFRREDVEPVVFDLIDNNSIMKKHFNTRKGIYLETGGVIVKYDL